MDCLSRLHIINRDCLDAVNVGDTLTEGLLHAGIEGSCSSAVERLSTAGHKFNDKGMCKVPESAASVHHMREQEDVEKPPKLLIRRTASEDCTTPKQYEEHEEVLLDAALMRRTISTPFDPKTSSVGKTFDQNQQLDSQKDASITVIKDGALQTGENIENDDPREVETFIA